MIKQKAHKTFQLLIKNQMLLKRVKVKTKHCLTKWQTQLHQIKITKQRRSHFLKLIIKKLYSIIIRKIMMKNQVNGKQMKMKQSKHIFQHPIICFPIIKPKHLT